MADEKKGFSWGHLFWAVVGGGVGTLVLTVGALDWFVTSSTADERASKAAVAVHASYCAAAAKADPEVTADALNNYTKRREITEKYARNPDGSEAAYSVRSACGDLLVESSS